MPLTSCRWPRAPPFSRGRQFLGLVSLVVEGGPAFIGAEASVGALAARAPCGEISAAFLTGSRRCPYSRIQRELQPESLQQVVGAKNQPRQRAIGPKDQVHARPCNFLIGKAHSRAKIACFLSPAKGEESSAVVPPIGNALAHFFAEVQKEAEGRRKSYYLTLMLSVDQWCLASRW